MKKIFKIAMLILFFSTLTALKSEEPLNLLGLSDYYNTVPDLGTCNEGVLKDSEKQKVLQQVNYIRKIHGLNPVTYNNNYDKRTAKAALIIASTEGLDHQPPNTAKCYSPDGYNGSDSSNLYITKYSGSGFPTSESSINQWMVDANVQPCGHRRWIINPFLKYISFGRVDGPSTQNPGWGVTGMTIWVISGDKADLSTWDSNFVAYPYHNYPKSFYFDNQNRTWYLSFSAVMDKSDIWNNQNVSYSGATVEMKDDGGAVLAVTNVQSENNGYAVPNLIKWNANLVTDKKYWVTIKNVNMGGTMKTFSYWLNVTDAPPMGDPPKSAPSLANPLNNATNQDINPTLSWSSVTDATFYNLQVSTTVDFSASVDNYENISLLQAKPNLNENTKYFWRVNAANEYGKGPWSLVRNLTTKKLAYSKVIALKPDDGATNVYEKTQFLWNKVADNGNYAIQIAKTNDFMTPVVEDKALSDTTYNVKSSVLEPMTTYYWRVRYAGMNGPGAWSTVRSFWSSDPSSVDGNRTISFNEAITVYPNPFNGNLNISFNTQNSNYIILGIYNSLGQKVLDIENTKSVSDFYNNSIDLNKLSEGTYFLRLTSDKINTTRMITKIAK